MSEDRKNASPLTLGQNESERRLNARKKAPGTASRAGPLQASAPGQAPREAADPDTYSVAGEEDPGAAVDAPTPPPTATTDPTRNGPDMSHRSVPHPRENSPVQKKPASPANMVSRTPRAPGSHPADESEEHLQLPHERDENAEMTGGEVRPKIKQAAKDLEAGMVDTDMRATPGLDARQRERYVAGPGGRPPKKDTGK